MHYLVYKTTNLINGKIYIGVHKTNDINDGYIGSGSILKRAMSKHGVDNFVKEILYDFDSSDDMFAKEAELVNEEFVKRDDTYNVKLGGCGGWDHIRYSEARNKSVSRGIKKAHEEGRLVGWIGMRGKPHPFLGKHHSDESKKKISENNGSNLSDDEIKSRLDKISGIDLTKWGWVAKVASVLRVSHTQARRFVDRHYKGAVYKRR